MLKLIVIFIAGLVIGAVWGWGAGIRSMLAKREACHSGVGRNLEK